MLDPYVSRIHKDWARRWRDHGYTEQVQTVNKNGDNSSFAEVDFCRRCRPALSFDSYSYISGALRT